MVSFDKFLLRKDLLFATSNERAISARLLVFLEACIANARVLGKDSTILLTVFASDVGAAFTQLLFAVGGVAFYIGRLITAFGTARLLPTWKCGICLLAAATKISST